MAIQFAWLGIWRAIKGFVGGLNAKQVFIFLQTVLVGIFLYKTFMFGYQWAWDRGAASKEAELRPVITQLELDLVREKQKLAELQEVYERAQASSALAQQQWERESAALKTRLNRRVQNTRTITHRERQLKNEIENLVPTDTRIDLPNGWVWLYNESGTAPSGTQDSPSFGTRGDAHASSGISYTDALHVIIENNAEFVKRGEIIAAWQEYYQQLGSMIEQYNQDLDTYYRNMGQITSDPSVSYFTLPPSPETKVSDISPSTPPDRGVEEFDVSSNLLQELSGQVGRGLEPVDPGSGRFLSREAPNDQTVALAH